MSQQNSISKVTKDTPLLLNDITFLLFENVNRIYTELGIFNAKVPKSRGVSFKF